MGSYSPDDRSLAEDNGLDLPESNRTLYEILAESARNFPERTALVSCHQSSDLLPSLGFTKTSGEKNYLRWSYTQLEHASEILAAYWTKTGVSKGDAIVIVLHSCAEWVLCFWAAARLGCPLVPINPVLVSRANELQHILSALERIGVLVADNESTVSSLAHNAATEVRNTNIKMIVNNVGNTGWTTFNDAMKTPRLPKSHEVKHGTEDTVLIVLTSGTTALPKGCPHTHKTVGSMCARHKIMYSLDETRVSCNHMPLFHLAGIMESLWAWAHGGTVVYPNKSFDARATLDAIDKEKCTDMCLVPSMLHSMIDHPILQSRETGSLGLIKLAANDVRGSDARACSEILHAKIVTNCFGMTETSGMTEILAWKDGVCKDSEPFPVGRMAPGAKARICASNTRNPVRRGEVGELHQGGRTITSRYIGGSDDTSSFYTDSAGLWHVSGDRAIMADTGVITVLGRYKDMINRAGENISPSTMERVLNQVKGIVSSQVVGIPDEIAGEVPVAVVKLSEGVSVSKDLLHDRIVKELGVAFALERVLDLKELAIDDFPITATGKVRKIDVRQLVFDHLHHEANVPNGMTAREPTEAALTRIWARFTGVPEQDISPMMSLEGMVDSVTVMRFRSQVKKELGKQFSLEELNQNPTIVKQAAILDRQQAKLPNGTKTVSSPVREGPPGMNDLVHARGEQTLYITIRREAETKLHILGLSWNKDVEAVLPVYDFLQRWRENLDAMIFRIAFACAKATTKQLRSALEVVLTSHGMLRTIHVDSALAGPSWVMIRPSSQWFDLAIKYGGSVSKPEDLQTTDLSCRDDSHFIDGKPVPLFYVTIYLVEATQSAGFVVYADHSCYDAHSVLALFVEDLGKALSDQAATLPVRPKYDLFANSYYNYRSSVPARLNLDYYTSRIKGIARRREGLWPKESYWSLNGPPDRTADQLLLKGNITPGLAGLAKHIKIDMSNNKYLKVYKIPHSVAIKAAVAIFNTQQTGHPYAFFENLQMCRSYPFLDPVIADHLPDPMDMPGATIEISYDNLHLDPNEPISALLHRMKIDQNEQTARAQWPHLQVREHLGDEDTDFLNKAFRRQAVNYNPVVAPDPNAPLQNLQFAGTANLSFMWWCGMVDAETVQMRVTWNDVVFSPKDAEMAMDGFERNMKWLVDGENWYKTIGDCDK